MTARVRERSGLSRRETVEEQRWEALQVFRGRVFVDQKEEARIKDSVRVDGVNG